MIGFYQMGYGVASFGVGPLQAWAKLTQLPLLELENRYFGYFGKLFER
jgi:hypothetical protein